MTARAHRLIVLENGVLDSMANNKKFTTEFPVLLKLQQDNQARSAGGKKSCGGCPGSNRNRGDIYQTVKQTLAGLATKRKSKLKEMLSTDKVQIVYRSNSGKAIKKTF